MNRLEKIEAIYKEIANKELSLWCRVIYRSIFGGPFGNKKEWIIVSKEIDEDNSYNVLLIKENFISSENEKDLDIIWHPIMIWDVLESFYWDIRFSDLAWIWKELREPIEEQSDECIDFIYNLIK